MKNTGVTRKIDELGRIVIPKEIRKNLNIHSDEDVQIFVEEDKIILKKYQKMQNISENSQKYIDMFSKLTTGKLFVSDKEKVISSSEKELINLTIDNKFINLLNERKIECDKNFRLGSIEIEENYYLMPIIIDTHAVGTVFLTSTKSINELDKMLVNILKILLISLIS